MAKVSNQPIRGTSAATTRAHERRTATEQAAFLLPHLRQGMNLLDCGSGPGTITLGLAEAVAPGNVVGIDLDPKRVEGAQNRATEAGVANVRFEAGSIYELPFGDGELDAVYANAVFEHLEDPAKAAAEVFRVLKPGGVFGVRDSDWDGRIWANMNPAMDEVRDFITKWRKLEGTNHYLGKELPKILRLAGFESVEISASVECHGTRESMAWVADVIASGVSAQSTVDLATAHGLADKATLEGYAATLRAWGAEPDTFHILLFCEVVGHKPE